MSQDSQNPAIVKKPKLLDQVRDAIRTKHYSMKTEEAYVHWIKDLNKILRNKIVKIRINWGEVHIYKAVKSLGGRWNERKKLWELPYGDVIDLGLEGRIVYESKENS